MFSIKSWIALLLIAISLCWTLTRLIDTAVSRRNSIFVDGYSEANALRASKAFRDGGFLETYGLSRTGYGVDFPGMGHGGWGDNFVYKHYPPGPEYLLTLYTALLGERNIPLFRIIHSFFFLWAFAYLLISLCSLIGPGRSLFVWIGLLLAPLTTNMSFGLHYQGLALSLLALQIGLICSTIRYGTSVSKFVVLFFCGLVQGYISFDYFFLVSLCAVPVFMILSEKSSWSSRTLFGLCVFSFLGFVVAHVIHLFQVILSFGGVAETLSHFYVVAKNRSLGSAQASFVDSALGSVELYLTKMMVDPRYLSIMGWVAAFLAVVMVLFSELRVNKSFSLEFPTITRIGVGISLIVSLLWIIVMPSHAWVHQHFIPRHFFLFYFCVLVAVARSFPTHHTNTKAQFLTGGLYLSAVSLLCIFPLIYCIYSSGFIHPRNWATVRLGKLYIHAVDQSWEVWKSDASTVSSPIKIAGESFQSGVGTHATSYIRMSLPSSATRFSGGCGVQDGYPKGTVSCRVRIGSVVLWDSGLIRSGDQARFFSLSVTETRDFILEVSDGGDSYKDDLANWVNLEAV